MTRARSLHSRPDSVVIAYAPSLARLTARTPHGDVAWRFPIPEDGALVGGFAVAPNSTTYLRTTSALLAVSAAGDLSWQVPLPRPPVAESLLKPTPLTNSGVVVIVAPNRLRAFSPNGKTLWEAETPPHTMLAAAPEVGPNGTVTLATDAAVMSLSHNGVFIWTRPLVGKRAAP